jgi:alpha-1,6-mannosyltransferase
MHLVDTTLFYSPTSGGVRRYLNAKHAWLKDRDGWQHTLLVPGDTTRLDRGGVSTIAGNRVPGTFNYRLPLNPLRWSRMLEALEPDLIEAGDAFHPAWCAAGVGSRRPVPMVAFFHSHLPRLVASRCGPLLGWGARRYLRMIYDRFDLVFAPSRVMADYLRGLGLSRVSLQVLGVDTEVFSPARREEGLRTELGLAPDTRLLVYAGRFSGEKNIPVLVDAMRRLGKPYHLLLIGGSEHGRPACNVTTLPYRRESTQLAAAMASADAFVHAGTHETFGLVVLEAMACGRPVVGVNAGAIAELLDSEVGVLAREASGAVFAQAVSDLYDRNLVALGAAARARVLAKFTWQRAFQHQLAAYSAMVGVAPLTAPAADAAPVSAQAKPVPTSLSAGLMP